VTDADSLVRIDLTESEFRLLKQGLHQWGGPARCSEEMAIALGFTGVADLHRELTRLYAAVDARAPLSRWDWSRSLLATEVVFSSYLLGAAWDWTVVSGMSDEETILTLRGLQKTLSSGGALVYVGTRPAT
jgi:hypothetical protein